MRCFVAICSNKKEQWIKVNNLPTGFVILRSFKSYYINCRGMWSSTTRPVWSGTRRAQRSWPQWAGAPLLLLVLPYPLLLHPQVCLLVLSWDRRGVDAVFQTRENTDSFFLNKNIYLQKWCFFFVLFLFSCDFGWFFYEFSLVLADFWQSVVEPNGCRGLGHHGLLL